MKEQGRYQLQLMKTRSSSGVGQKVELEFDINSMRIVDNGEEHSSYSKKPSSSIMDSIKNKTNVTPSEVTDTPKVTAEVQSAKLKQMLANLKK